MRKEKVDTLLRERSLQIKWQMTRGWSRKARNLNKDLIKLKGIRGNLRSSREETME